MYNFDQIIDRRNTSCVKYDNLANVFGSTDILPMWVADMDFQVAPEILDAARECCEKGIFGYTFRSDKAKQAFADWVARRHGWQVDSRWLLSSPGIVTALALGVRVYTEEHDKVMIFTPVYPPFYAVVKDNNRELVCSTLKVENGHYQLDWEDVEKKLKNGVKLLIMSNSHNPVGRVWTKEELTQIGALCLQYGVTILSDEIHSDLALFGHVTLEAAYKHGDAWLDEMVRYLEKNILFADQFLREELPSVKMILPEGSFLLWLDFRATGLSHEQIQEKLLHEAKLGLNSGTDFGPEGEGFFRMNIGCPLETVKEGLERLKKAFK